MKIAYLPKSVNIFFGDFMVKNQIINTSTFIDAVLPVIQGRYLAEHYQSNGKSGYSPMCTNKFKPGVCRISKGVQNPCDGCTHRAFVAPNKKDLQQHILGTTILGIYPLMVGDTTHWLAFDIDKHKPVDPDPWPDVRSIIEVCEVNDLPAYVLRSKSGDGYHIYLFFSSPVPAVKARMVGTAILQEAQVDNTGAYDRMFPSQDRLNGTNIGNLIAIPFQGRAMKNGDTLLFNPDGGPDGAPYPDQLAILQNISRIDQSRLDELISDWSLKPPGEPATASIDADAADYPPAYIEPIRRQCAWMQHCHDDAATLSEPSWYAALSIVIRCEDGLKHCHDMSRAYPGYDPLQCAQKAQQAKDAAGPATCASIAKLTSSQFCSDCQHWGRIKSPIHIGELGSKGRRVSTGMEPWPPFESISGDMYPVKPLTREIVPDALWQWANDVADRMQAPIDFVVAAALVMLSSAIGCQVGVRPKEKDDWTIIPNLWGASIGTPSKMKSPTAEEPTKMVQRLEIDFLKKSDESEQDFQNEVMQYSMRIDGIKKKMKAVYDGKKTKDTIEELQQALAKEQSSKPVAPLRARLMTSDPTIQSLCRILTDSGRCILLYRDELIGFLRKLDMPGHETDRSFYLEAWGGKGTYTSDTLKHGRVHADPCAVSVFGNVTPDKFDVYNRSALAGDRDGLTPRFQIAVMPDKDGWQWRDRYPDMAARNRVYEIFKQLVEGDIILQYSLKDEYCKYPYFRFDPDARSLFKSWMTELMGKVMNPDEHELIQDHLNKYRSLMPSLALIFHLVEIADSGSPGEGVSVRATAMAADYCDYLESHARRIYGRVLVGGASVMQALANRIESGALKDGFSASTVVRKRWSLLTDRPAVEAAIDDLHDAGWIRPMPKQTGRVGNPGLTKYEIRPDLSEVVNG